MKKKDIKEVSIIVPNYNNGKYLSSFINSVIESTVEPAELIIVDDGSKDNSFEVLKNFNSLSYLKVINFKENRGLTAALNAALEISTGKYVMRADPDDRLAPDRIEKQYHFMESHPDIDILGCNTIYFDDGNDKALNKSNFPETHQKIVDAFKKGEHGLQHPTAFVKGEIYRKYRYQKTFPGEDYEIFARMARDGYHFANLHEPLYFMRVHTGSATSNLKFEHIKVTFEFRDRIFDTKTPAYRVWLYYYYQLNYRRFQQSHNPFKRFYYLILAGLCHPKKAFKRIANFK